MRKYDHKLKERKWQRIWEKKGLYRARDAVKGKKNFYLLTEFPYPSGNLHVGHWYAFSVPDILARMLRMQGKNVLYPTGFDAFGLPAENAAIKNKLNPRTWTQKNIAYMKKQIRSMGTCFDWSREVVTCDPAYYTWTQWQFLQFFKKGLAYQKETPVNWCPKDKTVLANEQVVDGHCERCDAEVVQKQMLQWNLKITDYADRLIDDLELLDWPQEIKESQRNWIGRSGGAEIDFPLEFDLPSDKAGKNDGSKPNYLILHGWYASSALGVFIPWLKKELEQRGLEVQAPALPNPTHPKEVEQVEHILRTCRIDERTIIVGHSLGGAVAMKVLEKINRPIAGLVLVGSAINPSVFPETKERPFWKDFNWNVDYERIRKLPKFTVVISDMQEGSPRVPYLKYLVGKLGASLVEGNASEKHFMGKEESMVLSALLPHLTVFTTRPDTLYGATYLVLAPEHLWVTLALTHRGLLRNEDEIARYIALSSKKTELERLTDQKEKTGVRLEGVEAVNPATGKKIPIFVADYVLAHYGTGAIMAVPAHDERDFEFARKYSLPVVEVVEPLFVQRSGLDAVRESEPFVERNSVLAFVKHSSEEKYLGVRYKPTNINECVSGGIHEGEDPIAAAKREIREETGYTNARFVRLLGGRVHSKYYSVERKQNTFAHFTPLLFELENETREEISEREKSRHDISWLSREEMEMFLNRGDIRIAWSREKRERAYEGEGILVNSRGFDGKASGEVKAMITEKFGRKKTTYKLRDWIVSRQRYWGVPIPIIHCTKCGPQAVPEKDLPVKLPEIKDYLPDGRGKSPLAKVKKWMQVKCPKCKSKAERETDTLDTFVDSSWYFLRYTDPKNKKKFADANKMSRWLPVDFYSGGPEHTTMHVLYSRFWHKALFDLGLVKDSEPYLRRQSHGLILGPDSQKMSKSHGNVIDPDELVDRLGADTVRIYLAFIGPYSEAGSYPWNPDGVVGVRRFLERVWRVGHDDIMDGNIMDVAHPYIESQKETSPLESLLHKTIKKVGEDIAALKFNTAISALMIFLNALEKEESFAQSLWEKFLRLLAPFAPHIAEELWQEAGHKKSIHMQPWPTFDRERLKSVNLMIAVQINGKTRGEVEVAANADKEFVEKTAYGVVSSLLEGKEIIRKIFVPGRLVNFVVEG